MMTTTPSAIGATLPAPTAAGDPEEHTAAGKAATGASDTPGNFAGTTAGTTTVPGTTSEAIPPGIGGRGDLGGGSADVGGGGGEGGGDATAPPGRLASSVLLVRSLGRKSWRGRDGGRNARRNSVPDFVEIVKAAEVSEAVSLPTVALSCLARAIYGWGTCACWPH